jgi:hypothetical protein
MFCCTNFYQPAIFFSQSTKLIASPRRLEVHGIAADLPAEADPAFAGKFLHHLDGHGGSDWPCNVLRHSFISYRITLVKSADQVALEAGNSPSILFKHYRELTIEELAAKWFGILPKEGQWENTFRYDRKQRRVILNGIECD